VAFCTVCAHKKRAEIDMRLAVQVVNLSALGKEYGVKRDAVRRHRDRHLPHFLPAFAAQAAQLEPGTIAAEAQRLYLTALDNLARAEAGVTVKVTHNDDGTTTETHKVNSGAVARMIREARMGLDLLHKLSVASGASNAAPAGVDRELDERIATALERVASRGVTTDPHNTTISIDAVEYAELVPGGLEPPSAAPALGGDPLHTPGPSAAHRPPPSRDLKESQGAQEQSEHDGPLVPGAHARADGAGQLTDPIQKQPDYSGPIRPLTAEELHRQDEVAAEALRQIALSRKRPWDGNVAASPEERRAAGYDPLRVPTDDV
jgi:hypothetical protein